jgi:RimJ/RimL family protein N-acetyltransferase
VALSKNNMIAALPLSDGDMSVRGWKREDVETLARWPSYPPATAAFNLPYRTLAPADRKHRFDSKEAALTRMTLVADLPAEPVVAYLALIEIDWATGSAGNMAVRVKPAWCGRGLGTRLLRLVTQWCFAQGMNRLRLDVAAPNARAIRCYEKSGFIRTGEFWREDAALQDVDLKAQGNASLRPHVRWIGSVPQVRFYWMENAIGSAPE